MADTFKIGREAKGKLVHAFDIQREGQGIKLSKVTSLSDSEKHSVFAHFGRVHTMRTGGFEGDEFWEGFKEVEPGTDDHFDHAVRHLPLPFRVMG
jgi:hypothetical protein